MAKDQQYKSRTDENSGNQSESTSQNNGTLVFGKNNFKFILAGVALIGLGLVLMSGASMPSPDVWDESLIYSFRRITLAPILIILGLVVNVYAIFVKK